MHTGEVVGLIGAPNSGKTTLYNWLTGSKFKPVNYPGSTVDFFVGQTNEIFGESISVLDTPGVYSFFPKSPDEEVTINVLVENEKLKVKNLIVVVDGMQLENQLYLVQQAKEAGFNVIVAVTMVDLLEKDGVEINFKKLSELLSCKVVPFNGLLGGGLENLIETARKETTKDKIPTRLNHWNEPKRNSEIQKLKDIVKSSVNYKNRISPSQKMRKNQNHLTTQKFDSLLLHKYFGLLIFSATMMILFSSIFWAAAPLMDAVDSFFSLLAESSLGLIGENLFGDFIANGIIAGFGAVLVFVPQIFILFIGISALEDSGYLARAATLVDRPLSMLGMNGRSFVPLLSGFACAVPAMMAARTLGSKKDRWITMFIIPFMTCSARLPVYALLLSFLFFGQSAWIPGLALTALYLGGILVASIVAKFLSTLLKPEPNSTFLMELPIYRKPLIKLVLRSALLRTKSYIFRVGPVIFVLSAIIWVATTFPNFSEDSAQVRLEQSYAGQLGQVIEPVFEPMGADWRVGVGLITAFAAREVFVSSLAVMFSISEDLDEDSMQSSLINKMSNAKNSAGNPLFNFASVIALLIFFIIALQCISTTAIAAKEMNSWKFATIQLIAMNIMAYVCAVGAYQFLS